MPRRREGEPSPYWDRLQIVMKVQLGQMTAREAAQALGLSRRQYYRLEVDMLRAALGAVTPGKPGPKPRIVDAEQAKLEEQVRALQREREVLEIKVRHMEEIQKEMLSRVVGAEGGKKDARRGRARKPRPSVPGRVQAARASVRPGTAGTPTAGPGSGRPDGACPIDPLRVEEEEGTGKTGPEGA